MSLSSIRKKGYLYKLPVTGIVKVSERNKSNYRLTNQFVFVYPYRTPSACCLRSVYLDKYVQ